MIFTLPWSCLGIEHNEHNGLEWVFFFPLFSVISPLELSELSHMPQYDAFFLKFLPQIVSG